MDINPLNLLVFSVPTLLGLWLLYGLVTVVYRLYFHPLRQFPGPRLAAATFWYETYFDVFKAPGGQYMYELDRLHAIYGPVIRSSPEEIHVKDSHWYEVLYTGPGHIRDRWEKSIRANGSPGSMASAGPHDLHRMRRGVLNPFFSKKAVTDLEGSIRRKVDTLCEKFTARAKEGKLVDFGAASTALTLDVISEYCYGACYNVLEEPDLGLRWKRLMSGLFESVPIGKQFPVVMQVMQSLPISIASKLNPDFGTFLESQALVHNQARMIWQEEQDATEHEKPEVEEKTKTIFHGIMRSKLPKEEKAVGRLSDEAFVIIVAGGETTARVITVIMTYLLQNREAFNRLRKELDNVMKSGVPESRQLEEIPFMRAVVQEGLRLSSPVTNRPIFVAPNEDLTCNDWTIPRGTPVSMTLGNVLFDPSVFPNPKAFDPDRWLRAAEQGQRLDRYLVAFSKGTRSCLGMNLAQVELYLATAALVSRFDMSLHDFDRKRDLEIVRDTFVGLPSKESKGVRVNIKLREK